MNIKEDMSKNQLFIFIRLLKRIQLNLFPVNEIYQKWN